MKASNILLIGAYGQGNAGDELLLEACLQCLPGHKCIVTSLRPKVTAAEMGVRTVHSQGPWVSRLRAFMRCDCILVGGGSQIKLLKPSIGRNGLALLAQFACIAVAARSRPTARPSGCINCRRRFARGPVFWRTGRVVGAPLVEQAVVRTPAHP